MGCCISSEKKTPHQQKCQKTPNHRHFPSQSPPLPESERTHLNDRDPPPSLEEETVKEVVILSETRLPQVLETLKEKESTQTPITIQEQNYEVESKFLKKKQEEIPEISEISHEVSQVSEVYSVTESFSTATTTTTTTVTEKKEDEATSRETTRDINLRRSSQGNVPKKRQRLNNAEISRVARKSPAKRAATSPSRPASGREPGRVRSTQRNVGSNGIRRESVTGGSGGTCSRRSRSPAARTSRGMGKSPGKVTGRSGGRLQVENSGKKEKNENENDGVLKEQKNEVNDSIDNPHVSLECFIFL